MNPTDIFEARSLQKNFGPRTVVKGIDIFIRSGEIIGLLGRNGAGKTTTFQMMAGLLNPDAGTLLFNGTDISHLSSPRRARKGIVYLPQENSVFLKTSVAGNLNMILELQPLNPEERKSRLEGLLSELGLTELSGRKAHTLSGDERRRLEICRALILEPKFLLLDEPFTGIDPLTVVEIQKILNQLKIMGIGIIVSDHNVRDTFRITDRAYIIDEGTILIEGTPQKISADTAARERFLGKNFQLGQEVSLYSS